MTRKMLMLFLLLPLLAFGCAGSQPMPDHPIDSVFEAPGFTKEQIYNGAKIWIAENFKSSKAVLELEDKENGVIIGNGIVPYPCSGFSCLGSEGWKVPFTMRIDIKDYKFRLTFSNILLSCPRSQNIPAYEGPHRDREGFALRMSPILMNFGLEIQTSLGKNKVKSDW